jgi:NAD(P)-dependent dehydrogenase (short-subunit alcohol dehydrogenase family)
MQKLNTRLAEHPNTYNLQNKLAVITGASKGIGRAIASLFAENGANLILVSRDEKLLQEFKEDIAIRHKNIDCKFVICDLRNAKDCIRKLEKTFTQSNPDILVNNAGFFDIDSVLNNDREVWDDTVAVQLTAAYELSCYLSKFMVSKKWGRIINISSISAEGEKYALSYSATKAGLNGLTSALALELAKFGVTVNSISPGWVETEMALKQFRDSRWCQMNEIDPQQSQEIARLSVPQERLLEAKEVAHMAAFLCSLEAKGITGQNIKICGGLSLM